MRSSIKLSLLLLAVVPALTLAQSQDVPLRLGYQGRLLASDGTPLSGMKQITFSLYKAPTGEAPLWSETQQLALTNGYYATFLGATSSLGTPTSPLPNVFDGSDLYLGVVVGGTELSPRQRIGSVAYAMRAAIAVNAAHAAKADSLDTRDGREWLSVQRVAAAGKADQADHATSATHVTGGTGTVSAATIDAPTITAANKLESKGELAAVTVGTGSLSVSETATLRDVRITRSLSTDEGTTTTVANLNAQSILHVPGAVVGGFVITGCSGPSCSVPTCSDAWGDGRCLAGGQGDCGGGSHTAEYTRGVVRSIGTTKLCIQP